MSKISLSPDVAGTGIFTIASPGTNTNRTLTLPDDTGTIVTNSGNQAGSFTTLNTSGQVVFNDAGADVDFRVEGDTDANLLFVDASADAVGIGTNLADNAANKVMLHSASAGIADSLLLQNGTADNVSGQGVRLNFSGVSETNSDIRYAYIESATTTVDNNHYLAFGTNSVGSTPAERMRIDSSGNVIVGGTTALNSTAGRGNITINGSSTAILNFGVGGVQQGYVYHSGTDMIINNAKNGIMQFYTNDTERARIDSSGNLLVAKTTTNLDTSGARIASDGSGRFTVSNDICLYANRLTADGALVNFYQDNVEEGNISVSGNTVSYNPFLGSHSGALADWSKPEIKIGTVMDTIDELLEYKVVVIDVQEEVPAKEAVLDEEGNEVEPAQEATTQTVQKRISYNGNGAVGSSATVEYEGQEYTGIIHNEREDLLSFNKHLKVKINDTAASKAVFGVFVGWNNDTNNDGGVYNDMFVGAVGNYVIRIAAGQEPQIGDLVEADGNGCAVVQDDDIIRTKTIAKVTSTIKQVTYDDGSFLVTCVLYCG